MTTKRSQDRRGFTLIEVMLVLVILAMLAGVAIFAFGNMGEGAKIDATKIKLKQIETALDAYNLAIGHYPSEEEGGLKALLTKPTFSDEKMGEKWRGPYLNADPKDEWGNAFTYEVVTGSTEAGAKPYKLSSNGPDKNPQTDDDIKNWSDTTP
jgi:general secretion pathway protein G